MEGNIDLKSYVSAEDYEKGRISYIVHCVIQVMIELVLSELSE
jgi:hypothetical protein